MEQQKNSYAFTVQSNSRYSCVVLRQVAVMRMCDHPNVLSCYASFVHENELWLVMEFMSKGSCLHVMNVAKKEVNIRSS